MSRIALALPKEEEEIVIITNIEEEPEYPRNAAWGYGYQETFD